MGTLETKQGPKPPKTQTETPNKGNQTQHGRNPQSRKANKQPPPSLPRPLTFLTAARWRFTHSGSPLAVHAFCLHGGDGFGFAARHGAASMALCTRRPPLLWELAETSSTLLLAACCSASSTWTSSTSSSVSPMSSTWSGLGPAVHVGSSTLA